MLFERTFSLSFCVVLFWGFSFFLQFFVQYFCLVADFWEGQLKELRFKSKFRLARHVRQTLEVSLSEGGRRGRRGRGGVEREG